MLKVRQVLDHAQQDLLAEVLQIARRHALAIEPTEDQGTIQVRQVFPGIRLAGLGADQQALPGFVHGSILSSSDRAIDDFSTFSSDPCKVLRLASDFIFVRQSGSTRSLSVVSVPEPSTLARNSIAALVGLGDYWRRRRPNTGWPGPASLHRNAPGTATRRADRRGPSFLTRSTSLAGCPGRDVRPVCLRRDRGRSLISC
jgi:hypothetical protein